MTELQHILCIRKEENKMKVKFTYLSDDGKMWSTPLCEVVDDERYDEEDE